MTIDPNTQNLEKEKRWHEQKFYIDLDHWTSHPLFASRERHWLHYELIKIRFYGWLFRCVKKKPYFGNATILLAPSGDGDDLRYLIGLYGEVHGIDISPLALKKSPNSIIKKEADIQYSGYEDSSFDIIVCALFLHHLHDVGFQPFLREFKRILRKDGILAVLEPTSFHPMNGAMLIANSILGNVTGKVEGERAISPFVLSGALIEERFQKIRSRGLTFSHARFPVGLQLPLAFLDYPFRYFPPTKYFSSFMGWIVEKS